MNTTDMNTTDNTNEDNNDNEDNKPPSIDEIFNNVVPDEQGGGM